MNFKILLVLLVSTISFGQKGIISGTITDKDMNNESLPFANVLIKGSTIGTTTDDNGKYTLSVDPGNYTLEVSFLGYESQYIPITIKAGQTLIINKAMSTGDGVMLKDVLVQGRVNREKESALLLDQQKAVDIKQNIGAAELSRKGVGDVATAVTKTAGISKQEGSGTIYVRGLGDRYNSTSMNGLPIPSNDPEKKNINLNIFTTDIVEFISIDKVYNSKMYGDFAGGNVDINSKEYLGSGFLNFGIGSGVNTNALKADSFLLQDGPDYFGFHSESYPNNPLSEYNFSNSLNLDSKTPINKEFSISAGESFRFGDNSKLSFFSTIAFGNVFSYREGINRNSNNEGSATSKDFTKYLKYGYSTNTTGMANVGLKFNNNNKINYNFVFINSSSQSVEEGYGLIVDIANDYNGLLKRNTFTKNALYINQLLGNHKYNERINLNWGLSFNTIKGDMPDRMQNTLRRDNIGDSEQYVLAANSASDNHRYYQYLTENELTANFNTDFKFKKTTDNEFKGKATLGYSGRLKNRDFEATQFNFTRIAEGNIVNPNNLDAFFNQQNFSDGFFYIETFRGNASVSNSLDPQTYNGQLIVHATFAAVEYQFSPKFTSVIGLRNEYIFQKVKWKTQLDDNGNSNDFTKNALLPNITMKYELNEKQNLRFAASKTYTLPQFKETALFVYEDLTEIRKGNPFLYASDDYNVDLKWEIFPKSEELISITGFGKYIKNPMNEIVRNTPTNDITYANTGDYGCAFGGEFEIRKLIRSQDNSKLTAGLNTSYMVTNQELNSQKVQVEAQIPVQFTNDKDAFSGSSDLLINGDISYFKEWNKKDSNIQATVAVNYFSDRIYALGTNSKGNQVDKAVTTLDFIIRSNLNKRIGINFGAKNILDPRIQRTQENANGDALILSYKKGMNINLSITYRF